MTILKLDTIITKFKSLYAQGDKDSPLPSKTVIFCFLGLATLAGWAQHSGRSQEVDSDKAKWTSLDSYIPEGQTLVPISVANYESLDQVIGQYGVVDLLSTPLTPQEKPRRVAYAVKLIRSPLSHRHFSVLIPAEEAPRLAGYQGAFTVVVRNPKSLGTKFVKNKPKKAARQIVYETENP